MNITLKEFFLKTEEEKSPEKAIRELNKLVSKTYNHIINKNDYSSDYKFDKIINDFTDELIEVPEFILIRIIMEQIILLIRIILLLLTFISS